MATTPRPLNAAARNALASVVHAEQLRTIARMSMVRLIVGVSSVVAMVAIPFPGLDSRPSVIGGSVYLVAALLLMLVVRKAKALWPAYATAVLDIPLVVAIQWWQASMSHSDDVLVPTNIALMLGLVALSTLSMSRGVILATWLSAQIGLTVVTYPRVLFVPYLLVSFTMLGLTICMMVLVARVRQLVVESRQKDLLGKYVLGERLGSGGMAEVFHATYSPEGGFERKVAVKRILPSFAEDAQWVSLFRREAELGATLAHPNVVQVLDFGSDGATYFLAMEFIDGMPASRLLAVLRAKNQVLSINAVVWIASEVAEGLEYIHGRVGANGAPLHLVHRDLNPPNIMVSRIGEVKLADFGIARSDQAESTTRAGIVRGKLGYTSPEQLRGQPYDSRADLFALGVTLYELLTNVRVFQAEGDLERLKATLERAIERPSTLRPECPPELEAIVMGLCERELSARTPSATMLKAQLARLDPRLLEHTQGRLALASEVTNAMTSNPGLHAQVSSSLSQPLGLHESTKTTVVP